MLEIEEIVLFCREKNEALSASFCFFVCIGMMILNKYLNKTLSKLYGITLRNRSC